MCEGVIVLLSVYEDSVVVVLIFDYWCEMERLALYKNKIVSVWECESMSMWEGVIVSVWRCDCQWRFDCKCVKLLQSMTG